MLVFLGFPPDEERLLGEAAKRINIFHNCRFITKLKQEDPYLGLQHVRDGKIVFPNVVFIDGDHEDFLGLLRNIKLYEPVRPLPVVALAYSDDPQRILDFYSSGGNSYIQKPSDFGEMMRISSAVLTYWQDMTQLPSKYLPQIN